MIIEKVVDLIKYYNDRVDNGTPIKNAMRATVARGIRKGIIIKRPCLKCRRKADVEAHHPTPGQPLEIVWLCTKHHTEIHNYAYTKAWIEKQSVKII